MRPRAKEEREGGREEKRGRGILCIAGLEPGDGAKLFANTDQRKVRDILRTTASLGLFPQSQGEKQKYINSASLFPSCLLGCASFPLLWPLLLTLFILS